MKKICALAVALGMSVAYGEEGGATHHIPQSPNIPKQSPFTPHSRGPSAHGRGLSYSPQSLHLPQGKAADQPGLHPIVFSKEIEDSALAQLLLCLKKPRPDGKPLTRAETRECLKISHAALAEIETWVIELEHHLAECSEDLAQAQAQNISISESLLRDGPICPADL